MDQRRSTSGRRQWQAYQQRRVLFALQLHGLVNARIETEGCGRVAGSEQCGRLHRNTLAVREGSEAVTSLTSLSPADWSVARLGLARGPRLRADLT